MTPRQGRIARARAELSSPRTFTLLLRMAAWSCALRVLKHVVSLPRLVNLVRLAPAVGSRDPDAERRIVTLARWAARYTQWRREGACLERALVTYRYLSAANASPHVVVGVTLTPHEADGSRGHAWVTVDGRPADPADDAVARFVTVVAFGPDGRALQP